MKFIVDRTTWLRGEGPLKSFILRSEDQKQCCLGFLAETCGVAEKLASNITTLLQIPKAMRTLCLQNLLEKPGAELALSRAMGVNDAKDMPSEVREWAIQQALAPLGLEVEFVDRAIAETVQASA